MTSTAYPTKPLATVQRACCCTARPMVTVVLFQACAPARGAVDLLLCGHHYRVSCRALDAAGAMVLDADGSILVPDLSDAEREAVPV